MEEGYKLPEGMLVIGVVIAVALLIAALTRAYLRSRHTHTDTSLLDRVLMIGAAALGVWAIISLLWVLVAATDALLLPLKIMGVTMIFFAVGIVLAFAVAFVVGRVAGAVRR